MLDLKDLRANAGDESKCSAHYYGFGDDQQGETAGGDGACVLECLPSWYPAEPVNHRKRMFNCTPPAAGGASGEWEPSSTLPGSSLQCRPGNLSLVNTKFDIKADASSLASLGQHTKPWPFPLGDRENPYPGGDKCQGWKFADLSRPCFDGFQFAKQGDGSLGPTMNVSSQRATVCYCSAARLTLSLSLSLSLLKAYLRQLAKGCGS